MTLHQISKLIEQADNETEHRYYERKFAKAQFAGVASIDDSPSDDDKAPYRPPFKHETNWIHSRPNDGTRADTYSPTKLL